MQLMRGMHTPENCADAHWGPKHAPLSALQFALAQPAHGCSTRTVLPFEH